MQRRQTPTRTRRAQIKTPTRNTNPQTVIVRTNRHNSNGHDSNIDGHHEPRKHLHNQRLTNIETNPSQKPEKKNKKTTKVFKKTKT